MSDIPTGWTREGRRITSPHGSYITRHEVNGKVFYNAWSHDRCVEAGYGPEALQRCIEACERFDLAQTKEQA
jgi:hypothetical protein